GAAVKAVQLGDVLDEDQTSILIVRIYFCRESRRHDGDECSHAEPQPLRAAWPSPRARKRLTRIATRSPDSPALPATPESSMRSAPTQPAPPARRQTSLDRTHSPRIANSALSAQMPAPPRARPGRPISPVA